jgi:TonB family protein
MRLAILASLALLPSLAHAATSAPAAPADTGTPTTYTDVVHTKLNVDPRDNEYVATGALGNNFYGVSLAEDGRVTLPQLTHVVGRTLPTDLLSDLPKAEVSVRVILNPVGVPEYVTITHSAGTAIDDSTLAAVRQYRFSPAKIDGVPVESDLTLDIAIEKK